MNGMDGLRSLAHGASQHPAFDWVFNLCAGGWIVAIILALALCVPARRKEPTP